MGYSVVVVTWECAGHLGRLVATMNRYLTEDVELVVVDNASSDRPEIEAERWKGKLCFRSLAENRGFGAANNVGVELATEEVSILLNPDVELIDPSLGALARSAAETGGLVGPRIVNVDGSSQPSASGPPTGIWPWLAAVVPGSIGPRSLVEKTEPWRLLAPVPVAWLTGACIAAPTRLLSDLGPFDPSIHLYSEDLDLGLRAQRAGVPVRFDPTVATIVHFGKGSTEQRFADLGRGLAAENRRKVIARSEGRRAEALAWRAHLLELFLRVARKRLLRHDAAWDQVVLQAARKTLPPVDAEGVDGASGHNGAAVAADSLQNEQERA